LTKESKQREINKYVKKKHNQQGEQEKKERKKKGWKSKQKITPNPKVRNAPMWSPKRKNMKPST
jgi:hypothetical protein